MEMKSHAAEVAIATVLAIAMSGAAVAREPVVAQVPKAVPYTFRRDGVHGIAIHVRYVSEAAPDVVEGEDWMWVSRGEVSLRPGVFHHFKIVAMFVESHDPEYSAVSPLLPATDDGRTQPIHLFKPTRGKSYPMRFLLRPSTPGDADQLDRTIRLVNRHENAFTVREVKR